MGDGKRWITRKFGMWWTKVLKLLRKAFKVKNLFGLMFTWVKYLFGLLPNLPENKCK